MNHRSVILKKIRQDKKLTLRQAAPVINRSSGWLSEVENNKKRAFIDEKEFKRIISCYQAEADLKRYQLWAATQRKQQNKRNWFEGAIFKHLRKKRGLSLAEASSRLGISKSHLANIEASRKIVTAECKEKIFVAYNYKRSSYYNFTNIESHRNSIDVELRLKSLLSNMKKDQLEDCLLYTSPSPRDQRGSRMPSSA